jgi:flagellar protein FliS
VSTAKDRALSADTPEQRNEQGMSVTHFAASALAVAEHDQSASPYRMVCMLLDGATSRLARAECAAGGERSGAVSAAAAIVLALQDSLDLEAGGDLARNLRDLYDYMLRRLAEAQDSGARAPIAEVRGLLATIREGWDAIAPDVA